MKTETAARNDERPAPDAGAIASLRAHPRFPEALKYIAEALTGIYEGNRIMNAMLNDRARGQIGYLILMMQWASPTQYGARGVTMARLKTACVAMNYCSPNRVESIIAMMRLFGYVRVESDPYDHRVKMIVPTEKLINNYVERWRRHFQAMTLVMPEGETGLAALERPDFPAAFLREISKVYATGLRVANASPEIDTFLDRNCGMMVLLFLISKSAPESANRETLRAAVSISGLARRFGVSRAHVRKLLADAEIEGLVRDATGDTPVTLQPRCMDGIEKFYAATFLTFADAIHGATRETEANMVT